MVLLSHSSVAIMLIIFLLAAQQTWFPWAIATAAIHIGMILNAELRFVYRIWFSFCRQGQQATSLDTGLEPLT